MFKFYLYKLGLFILSRVKLQTSYRLASFISDIQFLFSFRDRKAVINNIRIITGSSDQLKSKALAMFRNFGRYLVEFFTSDLVNKQFIEKNVQIENLERIEKALSKGKGAIIITAHLGNWELGAIILGEMGYSLMAIALPHKERPVNDLFNSMRARKGITVVPNNVAVRRCLEALKANQLVALVADRDFGMHGEVMTFLEKDVSIPKGPAIFSMKTGAVIIPMFLIRKADGGFILRIEEPIDPATILEDVSEHENMIALIKSYLGTIETMIRKYPSQWMMFRPYWVNAESKR